MTPADTLALAERLEDPCFKGPMQHLRDWSDLDRLHAKAAAALRASVGVMSRLVAAEEDAKSNPAGGLSLGGLMDCRDNHGCVYQSADLASIIADARTFLPSPPQQEG